MAEKIRYWGYRIAKDRIPFFWEELRQGRLRQGWGADRGQNLRNLTVDKGARLNLPMLRVKRGDILLVPRLPEWGQVAIVEATEDWESGYVFAHHEDDSDLGHIFGHIFPAKFMKSFSRKASGVSGDLRSSLRTPKRFWNMDRLGHDIEKLRKTDQQALATSITDEERLESAVSEAFGKAFDEKVFGTAVYDVLNREFEAKDWENVLVRVFQALFPGYAVTPVGGRTESEHGTDIRISMPSIDRRAPEHVIAVQVKDYSGTVGNHPIDQIEKASWWNEQDGFSLVEKIVVMTKAHRDQNASLEKYAEEKKVRLLFADDLKQLLVDYAKRTMGLRSDD